MHLIVFLDNLAISLNFSYSGFKETAKRLLIIFYVIERDLFISIIYKFQIGNKKRTVGIR